jgi:hypothetical protein
MDAKVMEIFYYADEFSKQFDKAESGHLLKTDNGKKHRNRKFTVSDSGVDGSCHVSSGSLQGF